MTHFVRENREFLALLALLVFLATLHAAAVGWQPIQINSCSGMNSCQSDAP